VILKERRWVSRYPFGRNTPGTGGLEELQIRISDERPPEVDNREWVRRQGGQWEQAVPVSNYEIGGGTVDNTVRDNYI